MDNDPSSRVNATAAPADGGVIDATLTFGPDAPPGFKRRTIVALLPAMVAMYGVYTGVQQILLPEQVQAIDAAAKVQNLGVLSAIAGIAATVALPAGGALSDITRSRLGRRTPWLLAAALVAAGSLILMGTLTSIVALAVVFGLLWFTMNVYQGAIYAIIPDRVPDRLRGTASAVVGIASPLGTLIAVNAVARTGREVGYVALAAGVLVLTLVLLIGAREGSSRDLPRAARTGARPNPLSFFRAFRSLRFTLVFISRTAIFLAFGAVINYLFYILTDYIDQSTIPAGGIAIAVSTYTTLTTVVTIAIALLVGPLADKLRRRKLIVAASSVVYAVAVLVPLASPTWTGLLVYAVIGSIGIGAYNTVDVALMSIVLPDRATEGRDLALLGIATSGAFIFAPLIAAFFITVSGGYSAIFIFAAVLSLIGALVLIPLKNAN